MTIKEIRQLTGLSAQKFGDLYGIPLRTIQNWEGGQRQPQEYVISLLDRVVKEDKEKGVFDMRNININTFNSNITINIEDTIISIDKDMCDGVDCDTNIKEILDDLIDVQITDAGQSTLTDAEKEKIKEAIWITVDSWSTPQ